MVLKLERDAERTTCRRLRCDVRTWRRELAQPGSVRGLIGVVIRTEVDRLRSLRCGQCGRIHDVSFPHLECARR